MNGVVTGYLDEISEKLEELGEHEKANNVYKVAQRVYMESKKDKETVDYDSKL